VGWLSRISWRLRAKFFLDSPFIEPLSVL